MLQVKLFNSWVQTFKRATVHINFHEVKSGRADLVKIRILIYGTSPKRLICGNAKFILIYKAKSQTEKKNCIQHVL